MYSPERKCSLVEELLVSLYDKCPYSPLHCRLDSESLTDISFSDACINRNIKEGRHNHTEAQLKKFGTIIIYNVTLTVSFRMHLNCR